MLVVEKITFDLVTSVVGAVLVVKTSLSAGVIEVIGEMLVIRLIPDVYMKEMNLFSLKAF